MRSIRGLFDRGLKENRPILVPGKHEKHGTWLKAARNCTGIKRCPEYFVAKVLTKTPADKSPRCKASLRFCRSATSWAPRIIKSVYIRYYMKCAIARRHTTSGKSNTENGQQPQGWQEPDIAEPQVRFSIHVGKAEAQITWSCQKQPMVRVPDNNKKFRLCRK